ncbi:NrfD/PsrC family molybdoenzyme membrane anchor subunit [Desulfitobacterium hafniense]|uniref:NrfD/PsrC family molybdoenzyme membrane anchor subunit n=1 Tax=Desulfitobacterium hafniense TaxID=49338 RepID=UPI00037A703D|nr:NrfD/PsrC family molybdoenzyme membrane anchor subunit [Desulfitobacterium hafniense]
MSTTIVPQSGKKLPETGKGSSAYKIGLVIFGLLTLVGLAAWVTQLTKGLIVTDLGDLKMWGLYIAGFMFFTGIAAGSLIVASLPYSLNLSRYKPYAKIAAFLGAISSIIAAGLFILVDIGNPERLWYMVVHANLRSPMIWDSIIVFSYMFLSVYFLRRLLQVEKGQATDESVKTWSYVILVAGLLDGVTSFVFSLQTGRPFWHSPIEPVSFLVAAVVSGLALLMLLGLLLRSVKYITISDELLGKMGKAVALLLILNLCLVAIELITETYPGNAEALAPVKWLLSGTGAPMFWLELLGGSVLAIVLLLLPGTRSKLLAVGGILTLMGMFLKKFNMLMASLLHPLITYPGPPVHGGLTYFPSLVEFGVSLGIVSLGALLLMLGFKHLPLQCKGKSE